MAARVRLFVAAAIAAVLLTGSELLFPIVRPPAVDPIDEPGLMDAPSLDIAIDFTSTYDPAKDAMTFDFRYVGRGPKVDGPSNALIKPGPAEATWQYFGPSGNVDGGTRATMRLTIDCDDLDGPVPNTVLVLVSAGEYEIRNGLSSIGGSLWGEGRVESLPPCPDD